MTLRMDRRGFLKTTGALGTSLLVGFGAGGRLATADDHSAADLNAFVRVGDDDSVTVIVKHFEMGQGTTTGLSTLVAEEMDVPWENVKVSFAPSNHDLYKNLAFGGQGTGGSTAIANSWDQYRIAGAGARAVLIDAAAQLWNVDASDITVEDGVFKSGNKTVSIGGLVGIAAKLPAPEKPVLKEASQYKLIGNESLPRKDSNDKTTGRAMFSMDVKVPNMVYAMVLRSPKFGGVLKSFDASAAADVKGYVDAKAMPDKSGVAVFANSTWAAIKARRMISAEWDDSAADNRGSEARAQEMWSMLDADPVYDATGNGETEISGNSVDADFMFPLLAHAPMEPLNCVIEPTEKGVRVHDGTQFHMITHPTLAAVLQMAPEDIEIVTYYAGGSFGRRANPTSDYHVQAAMAYLLLGGQKAVKLVWTREDDLAGGYYRPQVAHRAHISVGEDGKISGWKHRTVGQSIAKGTALEGMLVHNGIDHFSIEGIVDTPYGIDNMSVGLTDFESPMSVLWWRSVGHSHSGYVMEVLMDMAAQAAEADPVAFRLAHLDESDQNQARFAGVLKLAAEKSGWGSAVAKGKGRGVAVHKSFNSYVALVTDVSVDSNGAISIDNITCAVDCGVAVNPDVVRAQMEGGIGYGLGAVMRNEITLTDGVVDQMNFPQYQPLRITDMPNVDVHIVASTQAPTGVGEPGLPPAGPSLANAIFSATGQRVTSLPLTANGITFA